MIQIHPYLESIHYPLISSWWEGHGWASLPAHKLPPFGFVACHDGVPIAASFAYMDNGGTGVAMLEWSVGNPAAEPKPLIKGIKHLFTFMTQELNKLEYDVIFTSCRQKGLARLLEKCGYQQTDTEMIHLVHINPSE